MNENSSDNQGAKQAPESTRRAFETFTEAFRAGGAEGAEKARNAVPELKESVTSALHDLIYGIAYGASFAGTFGQEVVPDSIKEVVSKGAAAGREAGKKASEKAAEAFSVEETAPDAEVRPA